MVSHGHRTEERRRVFNNAGRLKISKGAQGLKILCLSSMALVGVLIASSAKAQQAPIYSTGNVSAQTEVRLQQMETQIRDLTGKIEQQNYTIGQLEKQIKKLKESEAVQSEVVPRGASQIAVPEKDPLMAQQKNPLNLDFKALDPKGMQTAIPGGSTDATGQYEQAFAHLKSQNYDVAQKGFETFLESNSDHVLAANAKYWLGETFYVRGEYKKAAKTFAEGFQAFPNSAKSPDILLKLGMSLAGMGKKGDACVALSQLPVKFPTGSDPILERGLQEMDKLSCEL